MTEKEAQGNPAQPAGWAVGEAVDPDAYSAEELLALEEQKRKDTAEWVDAQNRSPIDNENPAQPGGWGVQAPSGGPMRGASAAPEVIARVFANRSSRKLAGAKVLLGTSQEDHQLGEVVARNEDWFGVKWRDQNEPTWERMADYELIIRQDGEE